MTAPAVKRGFDDNLAVADRLREYANLLQAQDANPFRVKAYRKAADTLAQMEVPVVELFRQEGRDALLHLPGIGSGIAAGIAEILLTGRWSQLERLRGSVEPEILLQAVPGVGPELARAIHEHLHVETLESLEMSANDGRLESVPGVGPRRAQMIRAALASILQRRPARGAGAQAQPLQPSVATLLEVDREYRERGAAGELHRIAPRRFNPGGEAWLPVLHTVRDGWHFTALYSNTAQAHRLGRTRDWVVIYFYDSDHVEGQHTVVTESRGNLAGKRVVRGREAACARCYGD